MIQFLKLFLQPPSPSAKKNVTDHGQKRGGEDGGIRWILIVSCSVIIIVKAVIILIFFGRFGRRKILLVSFLVAAVGAIGALLLSDKAEYDKGTL